MTPQKQYEINMIIYVDPDAPFFELENGNNEDVIMEMIQDQIYDLDDVRIKEIAVECLE